MVSELFIRYVIKGPHPYWWSEFAAPFLSKRGWHTTNPTDFAFESAYGFDPTMDRSLPLKRIPDEDYCLENASIVVEFRGEPFYDSVFFAPSGQSTIVDDMLAFMSLYSGRYCQYLWKESRTAVNGWSATMAFILANDISGPLWAAPPDKSIVHFERALRIVPSLNKDRFHLAIQWFLSALRESEIGRPLVESAMNWVCLESQANCLGLPGTKYQMVDTLLRTQRFPSIPHLREFYLLRNDAFHEGQLSRLSETKAQDAHRAGGALVRSAILNSLGMDHADFDTEFVKMYTE